MPSLGSILSTATTGLKVNQEAINVVAHNIANASSEGFSRQRAVLGPLPSQKLPSGIFGTGVQMVDVQRIRDPLLDSAYRREATGLGENQARSSLLGKVETILMEPSEEGLASALDQFFSAWSGLASDPAGLSSRGPVHTQARTLTDTFHDLARTLDVVRQEAELGIAEDIRRVNELTQDLADLNRDIVSAEVEGNTAGDQRDQRDLLLDELASIIPTQVIEELNGSVRVVTSGLSLVDGVHVNELEMREAGGVFGVGMIGHPGQLPDQGGSIGGALQLLNTDLPSITGELDALAEAMVTEINALHRTGTNPNGDTGIDFFDPTGVTATSISLSAAVLADPNAISAGTGGPSGEYRAGANDVALALAGMRDQDSAALGRSYGDHFRQLTSDVGFMVHTADNRAEVHGTLADHAKTRRNGYSGVSTDEELMQLIRFQTAYQAAARVITTADEMLESLIRM
jgi:flagellar hook-associated protein 1 FlgK